MKVGAVVLLLGLLAAPLAAQQIDPDWCLTCRDSRDHFLAGGGVALGARLVLPKARPWQRVAVVATVALAYELGQEGVAKPNGLRGPGYGISPKDWLLTVAGGVLVELLR